MEHDCCGIGGGIGKDHGKDTTHRGYLSVGCHKRTWIAEC